MLSALTLILLIEVTIKNRSVQKGHCNFGTPPCAPSPASPLAWECGGGVFSPGFPRDPDSHLNSYQPLPHKTVTFVTTSHRGQLPAHPEAAHSDRQTQGLPWQSSGENSCGPHAGGKGSVPGQRTKILRAVHCNQNLKKKIFFLKTQDRHTGWQVHQNTPEIHQQTHACCHSSDTDHTQNRTTHTSTERHIC